MDKVDIYQNFKRCGLCGSPIYENREPIMPEELNNILWFVDWDKVELDYCLPCGRKYSRQKYFDKLQFMSEEL